MPFYLPGIVPHVPNMFAVKRQEQEAAWLEYTAQFRDPGALIFVIQMGEDRDRVNKVEA